MSRIWATEAERVSPPSAYGPNDTLLRLDRRLLSRLLLLLLLLSEGEAPLSSLEASSIELGDANGVDLPDPPFEVSALLLEIESGCR